MTLSNIPPTDATESSSLRVTAARPPAVTPFRPAARGGIAIPSLTLPATRDRRADASNTPQPSGVDLDTDDPGVDDPEIDNPDTDGREIDNPGIHDGEMNDPGGDHSARNKPSGPVNSAVGVLTRIITPTVLHDLFGVGLAGGIVTCFTSFTGHGTLPDFGVGLVVGPSLPIPAPGLWGDEPDFPHPPPIPITPQLAEVPFDQGFLNQLQLFFGWVPVVDESPLVERGVSRGGPTPGPVDQQSPFGPSWLGLAWPVRHSLLEVIAPSLLTQMAFRFVAKRTRSREEEN